VYASSHNTLQYLFEYLHVRAQGTSTTIIITRGQNLILLDHKSKVYAKILTDIFCSRRHRRDPAHVDVQSTS